LIGTKALLTDDPAADDTAKFKASCDMVYAGGSKEVAARRKETIRKWRLKCRGVADSLEEAGEQLFTHGCHPRALNDYLIAKRAYDDAQVSFV
jgi:hypothetical protein